jgi:prepilin-type processing-associated H-X9-DG protein/prepilin-type N-terminal cleavage/methylation domain-containing protein
MPAFFRNGGFSLMELLVVLVLLGLLTTLGLAAWSHALHSTSVAKCSQQMRTLGQAFSLYQAEHQGQFPRSWHSAGAHREPGWAPSIAPYLGLAQETLENDWAAVFNQYFRSPTDTNRSPFVFSYAMNVHFELDPNGDDYIGSPSTWRRAANVPQPGRTILLGPTKPVFFGDHLMCHQWSGVSAAKNALHHDIHGGKAHYLFVDGHVQLLAVEETFHPTQSRNLWNPSLAGP